MYMYTYIHIYTELHASKKILHKIKMIQTTGTRRLLVCVIHYGHACSSGKRGKYALSKLKSEDSLATDRFKLLAV